MTELAIRHPLPGSTEMAAAMREAAEITLEEIEADAYLSELLDRRIASDRRLAALRLRPHGADYLSREYRNALRMRAGLPFWDRDAPEP